MESMSYNKSVNRNVQNITKAPGTYRINSKCIAVLSLQTYFIKANSNSVSDWYFRVMTKAEECRIEFQVEVFRINKNNHGLVEVEGRWMGRRKNASISNIIITLLKLKSYPLNHDLIRNHNWTIQKHAHNSIYAQRYKL